MFLRSVKATFEEIDVDNSGTIDETELYIGVLLIYNRINALLPTHNNPPTKSEVVAMMAQFDANNNKKLDRKEFTSLAKALIDPSQDPKLNMDMDVNSVSLKKKNDDHDTIIQQGASPSLSRRASGILPGIALKLIMTTVILPLAAYISKERILSLLDSTKVKEYVQVFPTRMERKYTCFFLTLLPNCTSVFSYVSCLNLSLVCIVIVVLLHHHY